MSDLLKDKNIVITGCLKGIGRTTLEVFAKNKANIFACVQYPDVEFEEFIQKLCSENDIWIKPIYFDLSDYDAIKEGVKQIISAKIQIHGLVNIAGMVHNGLFHMTSIEKMKEVFDIDFFSQMYITQYVSKIMMKYKSGSIVSISSITGIDGNSGQIAYSAAKAALIGSTKPYRLNLVNMRFALMLLRQGLFLQK